MRSMITLALLIATVAVAGFGVNAEAASKDPLPRLFQTEAQKAKERAQSQARAALQRLPIVGAVPARAAGQRPRVVCGMTVIPVDPNFDAAIRMPAPLDPRPAARTMPAPSCQSVK